MWRRLLGRREREGMLRFVKRRTRYYWNLRCKQCLVGIKNERVKDIDVALMLHMHVQH